MSATFEVKPAPPAPAPRQAVKPARKFPRTGRRTAAGRSLRRHWQLYLLLVVPLAYFVIFKYIPIANAVIAFKDYSPIKGPWGSDWVGFKNFELFFQNPVFWTLVKNTFFLAAYTVMASFPIPIVLAIALNEIRNGRFKKQDLGMLNTRWAMVIPSAIGVWQVIIARTFFRSTIPDELYEAATIDGGGDLRFLWSIVIPLSKPVIAVIALMYAIFQWNSYFDALIYLKDPGLYPLQIVLLLNTLTASTTTTSLAQQLEQHQLANVLKYPLIVISSLPVLIIYPFVARHFTKGVMVGAVKG